MATKLNPEVTKFLDGLDHPLREVIESLRKEILNASAGLSENIKWNGPNYVSKGNDRITMKIHPPKQIQLVFHRGAKVLEQPPQRLINDDSGILVWKANDRAVAGFKSEKDVNENKAALGKIVKEWVKVSY